MKTTYYDVKRLNKAELPVNSKNPILLQKAGHLVNLIIEDAHIKKVRGLKRHTG